jgi:hypothetical protein
MNKPKALLNFSFSPRVRLRHFDRANSFIAMIHRSSTRAAKLAGNITTTSASLARYREVGPPVRLAITSPAACASRRWAAAAATPRSCSSWCLVSSSFTNTTTRRRIRTAAACPRSQFAVWARFVALLESAEEDYFGLDNHCQSPFLPPPTGPAH